MYSVTKVIVATAMLSGNKPAVRARGWPEEEYSSTKVITTTPASCFSTSSKTSCLSTPTKPVVKCSTSTPWIPKTLTTCSTITDCFFKTTLVKGTPVTIKMTSSCPSKPMWTPMPPPKKPVVTTSCSTLYSTKSGSTCSSVTKTFVSLVTQPAKQYSVPKMSTTCQTVYSTSNGKIYSSTQKIVSPIWTPIKSSASMASSSSSCKKTSSPVVWYPESTTSGKAVTSTASQSSASTSSKATSSKASNATSSWVMPTHPIPTMVSSASTFAGASVVLSALAAVALVMAAV